MSSQYFKYKIEYDNNCGDMENKTLYVQENNTIDFRVVVNEDGTLPEFHGSDCYCDAMSVVLGLGMDCKKSSYSVERIECGWLSMPDPVKEYFNPRLYQELKEKQDKK